MVSVGLKALPSRTLRNQDFSDNSFMGEEGSSSKQSRKKLGMKRKAKKGAFGFDGDSSGKNVSGKVDDVAVKSKNSIKHQKETESRTSFVRKQVDPETVKYFSEIANLFESNEVEMEERSVICGNALEEAKGKELELATDYIISHTLQTLLEGCDVDHLCSFLRGCINVFPLIAMDRSGSHVAETALKSLSMHLQDPEAYSLIQEIMAMICEVIVVNAVELMCNCYGSHVLRRLLCLCQGVPLDSAEFHGAKTSTVLAERLNFKPSQPNGNDQQVHEGFPDLLRLLVSGMVKSAKHDFKTIQVNQHGSLVLQTALKLLAGQDQELLQVIPSLLGCHAENMNEENFIETSASEVVESVKETAYSHLMEVILEISPRSLFDEMFKKIFKNSLFELSCHPCGNFVVQALIAHARSKDQMELILKEIGPKFGALLELGRSGVIASLMAASQRLQTNEYECCEALSSAVCSRNESPSQIVPRILFLDSYFSCGDKSTWSWLSGSKMHVVGSLILQTIFRFGSELIQPFITSITSMEPEHTLEAAKDARGARVIEAFLNSNASTKQKRRLLVKLRGHYGQIAMHPSGSFTVERCFAASNLSLKEAIVAELVTVRADLSKSKQGPYLLRKLDVDEYASKPDRWRSRQESKKSAYKEFYAAFGSGDASSRKDDFLSDSSRHTSKPKEFKNMRQEIDDHLSYDLQSSGSKHHPETTKHDGEYAKPSMDDDVSLEKGRNHGKRKKGVGSKNTGGSGEAKDAVSNNEIPFLSYEKRDKKRQKKLYQKL